jgi:hypothetical protein
MNFSLKSHPLVAHWVPGFVVLTMWLIADVHYANIHSNYIAKWSKINALIGSGFGVLLVAIVPFVLGQVLDALRNWNEDRLDKKPESKIDWLAQFKLNETELNLFEDTYFTYYAFSANLCIGLVVGFLSTFFLGIFPWDHWFFYTLPVCFGICLFFRDAKSLRKEIREFLNETAKRNLHEKS